MRFSPAFSSDFERIGGPLRSLVTGPLWPMILRTRERPFCDSPLPASRLHFR